MLNTVSKRIMTWPEHGSELVKYGLNTVQKVLPRIFQDRLDGCQTYGWYNAFILTLDLTTQAHQKHSTGVLRSNQVC